MTRLENYRQRLSQLEARRNAFMRQGQYVKYQEMSDEIKKVEALIKEAEEYELSCQVQEIKDMTSKEELDAMGIIPLMIESYLISDMLVEWRR